MTTLKIIEREYEITLHEFAKKLGLEGKVKWVNYNQPCSGEKKEKSPKVRITTEGEK